MIYIDEIKNLKLYNRQFLLPRNGNDRRKNNAVFLLTPNYQSSVGIMKNPMLVNKFYNSYFLDRNVSMYIDESAQRIARIDNEDKYVHEVELGEEQAVLSEGFYSHVKQEVIFNGYSNDVQEARKYITVDRINVLNNGLKAKINYPISVTVYSNAIPKNVTTTANSIYITSYDGKPEDYALYCDEEIIKMIILNINSNLHPVLVSATSMVLSGGYDKYKNEFVEDDDVRRYMYACESIKTMVNSPSGYHKVSEMIRTNNPRLVFKIWREDGIVQEDADVLKKLKRSIKYHSRMGSAHILNKISRNVLRTVDPNETTPDFKTSDKIENEFKSTSPVIDAIKGEVKSTGTPESTEESAVIYEADVFQGLRESYSEIGENHIINEGIITFFNEDSANMNYSASLRKILYRERIRTNKDIIPIYEKIKVDCPDIRYTYLSYQRYKNLNLFVDLYYYNELYFKNSMYSNIRGLNLYKEFLNKLLNNKNFIDSGYNQKKTIIIPIEDWCDDPHTKMWMYTKDINPISIIYNLMVTKDIDELKKLFGDSDLVFISKAHYFKINFSDETTLKNINQTFLVLIKKILTNDIRPSDVEVDNREDSTKVIVDTLLDDMEKNSVKISNLTGGDKTNTEDKQEILDKLEKVAATADSVDDATDTLGEDDDFKKLLVGLMNDTEENVDDNDPLKLNKARKDRISKLDDELLEKSVQGKSVREILNARDSFNTEKLKPMDLPIDSINKEWHELVYPSLAEQYDPNDDIVAMLASFSKMSYPINVRNIEVVDNSNSEDYILTYNVDMENHLGKRFKLKFDVPKLKNNKYMMLRGNRKYICTQSFLMPIVKTDEDTVQIVSNYNKIFIRRFGTTTGKSNVFTDYTLKTLAKYEGTGIKTVVGDNTIVSSKYDLPIDYIDISSQYTSIETGSAIYYFNLEVLEQEAAKRNIKLDTKIGLPLSINKSTNKITYFSSDIKENFNTVAGFIYYSLCEDKDFRDTKVAVSKDARYTYSKASILSTDIPLIVLLSYSEGLTKVLDKSGITYNFVEKLDRTNDIDMDRIKFSDGYLVYKVSYASSLLLNGLKECSTNLYSVGDVNKQSMYVELLDNFGGRIKADGIDNFYDCMIEPNTRDTLSYYNLPTDYVSVLLYANGLLSDNKFIKHTSAGARRLRRNELIPAYAYKALSSAYGSYTTSMKHGRATVMSMKQSAVIDAIMADPTSSDLSIINALGEKESYDTVTTKGLSGMNSDRSYSLDKRGFDESMLNVVGMSTGFAGTVGINRQATINANVETVRGYISTEKTEMNSVNSFCMSEALTPLSTTRDDPFRSAMTFIQTTKHGMRVQKADPLLVTNGADEALPYLTSDLFAYKAKEDGSVIEIDEDHIILQYKNGVNEYVDLSSNVEKNSSAGFYVPLKLDTNLKLGNKVKKGSIVAYDKTSFSDSVGINNNPAYLIGTLAKCAILDTDEGFEDSAIISDALSKAMGSPVIVQKEITINKNTNIYNLIKKGTPVEEGDTLMTLQTPFEDADANMLLKNLVDDPEAISELGRTHLKSKVTGFVHDIKIYRTVELEELSDSLRTICKAYEKPIKAKKAIMNKHKIEQLDELDADYKLNPTGKLKDAADGVKIIIYLRYDDIMSVGDKLIYWSANKGVVKTKFPVGLEPYSLSQPEEKIHSLLAIAAINGRMVASINNIGVLNRIIIETTRKGQRMAGIKPNMNLL